MQWHQKSQSWAVFSSPADLCRDLESPPSKGRTRSAPPRWRSPRSGTLFKGLTPSGSIRVYTPVRKQTSRKWRAALSPLHWLQERDSERSQSESDEVSSFVASRSNSVSVTAPVRCPPIPAENEPPVHMNSDPASPLETHPLAPAAQSESTSQPSPRVIQDTVKLSMRPQLSPSCSKRQEETSLNQFGSFNNPVYEMNKTSLAVVFHSRSRSNESFSGPFITTEASVGERGLDPMSSSYDVSSEGTRLKSERSRHSSRSILLSGEVRLCPEEGILTLERLQSLQKPPNPTLDHKTTRKLFRNGSNRGRRNLRQRLLQSAVPRLCRAPRNGAPSKRSLNAHSPIKRALLSRLFPRTSAVGAPLTARS